MSRKPTLAVRSSKGNGYNARRKGLTKRTRPSVPLTVWQMVYTTSIGNVAYRISTPFVALENYIRRSFKWDRMRVVSMQEPMKFVPLQMS